MIGPVVLYMFLFLHLILQDLWTLFHKIYTQTEAEYESCIYTKYISYIHSYFIEVTDTQEIDSPFFRAHNRIKSEFMSSHHWHA